MLASVIWDRVYFTTSNGKVMLYSVDTGGAHTIVQSSDTGGFHGIAYGRVEKRIYFSRKYAIYRANPDVTGIELALSDKKCELYNTDLKHCFLIPTGNKV